MGKIKRITMAEQEQQSLNTNGEVPQTESAMDGRAEEDSIEQEADYADQLNFQRERENQAINSLQEEGRSFGSPSLIKYFVLFFALAVPNDVVDALELTGLLAVLAWLVSFLLSVSSILISWFFDIKQTRANNYLKKVEEYKKTAIRLTKSTYRVTKFFRKNPTVKILAGSVAEMIPLISLFPWSSISVILAYMDERKSYKNAKETSEEISNISIDNPEVI